MGMNGGAVKRVGKWQSPAVVEILPCPVRPRSARLDERTLPEADYASQLFGQCSPRMDSTPVLTNESVRTVALSLACGFAPFRGSIPGFAPNFYCFEFLHAKP